MQKKLQEERGKLSEELRKLEEQKSATKETEYLLRLKELEKQLDDQKKLAEEMRRKAEQGSMQMQGEVQELALEALLHRQALDAGVLPRRAGIPNALLDLREALKRVRGVRGSDREKARLMPCAA